MAVVINGSGTVTGLAVGGLPDGTVDTDTLANNAVVTGKISDGTITNADVSSSAAIDGSKLTGINTNTPAFLAQASSGQIVSHQTTTTIQFGTEVYDTDSKYDTSTYRFTPASAGKYVLFASVTFGNMVADKSLTGGIRKNGDSIVGYAQSGSVVDDLSISWTVIDEANTTDYYDVCIYHRAGSSVTTQATRGTIFGAYKLTE